tara:strand:- start:1027 stop:1608 length:582 start_codon:yes stop_codon:yes gene_type:complete
MSRVKVPRETVTAVFKQTGKFVKPNAEPRLRKQFKKIKEKMMSEFNDHPVTRELDQKTSADPSSFVGDGSLFGFIGFDRSDEPTQIVREMLDSSELKFIRIKGETVDFKIFYPSKEELFEATPLPWAAGRSWLKGIESGLSGLGKYLNIDSDTSRSGGGVQSESSMRSARFRNTKYITEILNNFIKKIDNLSL